MYCKLILAIALLVRALRQGRFDGISDVLRNMGDDYSLNMFDEQIRGKTDRFVMKFCRPEQQRPGSPAELYLADLGPNHCSECGETGLIVPFGMFPVGR